MSMPRRRVSKILIFYTIILYVIWVIKNLLVPSFSSSHQQQNDYLFTSEKKNNSLPLILAYNKFWIWSLFNDNAQQAIKTCFYKCQWTENKK